MSAYAAYRRQPVPQQVAQQLRTVTFPAPTRGIIEHENEAFMQPGGAIICDNWVPTMRGVKLRGGCVLHCQLPETTPVISAFEYVSGTLSPKIFAANETKLYDVTSTTPVLVKSGQLSGNYSAAQLANASGDYLTAVNDRGDPPLRYNGSTWATLDPSAITAWANSTSYAAGATAKDTADNTYWKVNAGMGHTSPAGGTFAAARAASPTQWTSAAAPDGAAYITGPAGTPVANGSNLVYVWKYRNRLFFIQAASMDAWYLDIDAIGGVLKRIPLSGAASRGGRLMFGASWSLDAGDGISEKCCFFTSEGEVLIFVGTDPGAVANWRQEGRYYISPPMGINAHVQIGGDLMILTVDGIVPLSQAITKSAGQLELAMITRAIKPMWRREVAAKRAYPWTIEKWDENGIFLVTWPGGLPGNRYCAIANNATGAWSRSVGWDAMCFMRLGADLLFGTQDGKIMLAHRTGFDDGVPYVATLVGGWETFGSPSATNVWRQARAVFATTANQMFIPQLAATVDYVVKVPPPPQPGPDVQLLEVWDQGLWDDTSDPVGSWDGVHARWDQPGLPRLPIRNTMWKSIGMTGFAHAPIVQVTVAQSATPDVELIAISAIYEPAGVNV